jgi:dimeric dUTPase (all-alpha-NTP-PPase superfamily)
LKILDLFNDQKNFSDLIGTPRDLTDQERDDLTKTLSLALHTEVSNLVSATSYRSHSLKKVEPNPDKIMFESVDVVRYAIAIMNLWDITPKDFESAWSLKDNYLTLSRKLEKNKWKGEKVAIVDMDDVLCEFRKDFSQWLSKTYGIVADVNSPEYYFIAELERAGINPEGVFDKFISEGGFLSLSPVKDCVRFMQSLKDYGYFIQILTARPESNLRCCYDTYSWLINNKIPFDRLAFASEKLRWCMQSEYWVMGGIDFAIDDSPKHSAEYAKHGVKVMLPNKSYNKEIQDHSNVIVYENLSEIISFL